MRIAILSFCALVLPYVWGWMVYRLMKRLWPETDLPSVHEPPAPTYFDYQI